MTHEALERCPFCNSALVKPTPVSYLRLGLAMMHPGGLDDNSCPLAGWGFYDEELTLWNTRPANPLQAEVEALRAENARFKVDGIHTCHAECPRWGCVLRRENGVRRAIGGRCWKGC